MNQLSNIIRVQEGNATVPYTVYRRLSPFANVELQNGLKVIREQRGGEAFLLICEQLKDASWEDIPSDGESKSHTEHKKERHADTTA